MTHDDVEIRPLDLLDPAQHTAAAQWIEVHAGVQRETFVPGGSSWTLQEIQRFYGSPSTQRLALAAWAGGRLVGAAEIRMPLTDNLTLATLWLSVAPAHRRRGVGTALLHALEHLGAQYSRSIFIVVSEWAPGGLDPGEAFAIQHGYAVAQTMLRSGVTLGQAGVGPAHRRVGRQAHAVGPAGGLHPGLDLGGGADSGLPAGHSRAA